nr:hypothetical protein CFP56_38728 [Quercus suber]
MIPKYLHSGSGKLGAVTGICTHSRLLLSVPELRPGLGDSLPSPCHESWSLSHGIRISWLSSTSPLKIASRKDWWLLRLSPIAWTGRRGVRGSRLRTNGDDVFNGVRGAQLPLLETRTSCSPRYRRLDTARPQTFLHVACPPWHGFCSAWVGVHATKSTPCLTIPFDGRRSDFSPTSLGARVSYDARTRIAAGDDSAPAPGPM